MSIPQLKEVLQNPAAACLQHWGEGATCIRKSADAAALVNAMEAIKPAIKQKKIDKQECARDFGRAKSAGGNLDELKLRMQQVSTELTELEQQQKNLEADLLALFVEDDTTCRQMPQQFREYSATSIDPITVSEIDGDASAWNAYVEAHPQASLYHDFRWRDVVRDSFGHETRYLQARDASGRICGVLPLIRLRSHLFGDYAVSVPFFNYGGPLADNLGVAAQLLDAASKLGRTLNLQHIEFRATRPLNDWPARTDKVSMIRQLPRDAAILDAEIGAKVRAQIKKARQGNVQICCGHLDLLDDFYRVFAINMRDLGTPVYGKNFFRNILQMFPDQSHLVVVRLNGKAVAAAFLLGHRDLMEIPWASTLREVNALNINMLMYREVLGFCIARGYAFFDFGRSTADSGTFRFKKQWGAEPLQHYWHYWLRDGGDLPALKPDSPKFRLAVSAWQRLPVAISKLIGPHIVKYLP